MSMKIWARLDGDIVAETIELPDDLQPGQDIFHPDLVFVECDATVRDGWTFADGGFSAPVTPSLSHAESVVPTMLGS